MSKQVRIDNVAHESLRRISTMTGRPKSLCASIIVEAYEALLNRIEASGAVLVTNGQVKVNTAKAIATSELVMPLLKKAPAKKSLRE